MAQHYYIEIRNEYLGKYRRVTGRTRREVELKAAEQLQRWSEQELRALEREAIADLKDEARAETEFAQSVIAEWRGILQATLSIDDRLDWSGMRADEKFRQPAPSEQQFREQIGVPRKRPFLEKLRLVSAEKREEAEARAQALYQKALENWRRDREQHEAEQRARNESIQRFRESYERGDKDSVEDYVSLVLAASALPHGLFREAEVAYDPRDKSLIVHSTVPAPDDLPTTIEHRFIASRRVVEEKKMKKREIEDFYEDAIIQLTLRTIHEVFEGDYAGHCELIVFNGVVNTVDQATGRDYSAVIVSCQTTRNEFLAIDLARVDPRTCFRALKGLSGARLVGLQPVRPIKTFDREDPRFIEAEGVLEGLAANENLMTMEWQQFEVLVRDLFEKMFALRDADVKVTRSSRDQGVDAVVFDPDPLTGGKIVIQAKRYRSSVPVAAVRELYGTMLNEGAGKGILVTTSHFGASASEFIKDKPITLIDGANLLHYLQNHGHEVRIDVTEGMAEDTLLLEDYRGETSGQAREVSAS